MKNANLILHCGANRIEREELAKVSTPSATDTWCPIPHLDLISEVEGALGHYDLEVCNQTHALTKEGNRYFGLLQVRPANDLIERDYAYVVGLRNSHDKSFPAGLVVGQSVFVCDNLSFSGQIGFSRKHTSQIREDLPRLTSVAVGRLMQGWTRMDERVDAYKKQEIDYDLGYAIIVKALEVKAITLHQLPKVVSEFQNPRHEEFKPMNMWRLFNGFTEVMKSTPLSELPRRSIALQGMLDHHTPVLSRGVSLDLAPNRDVTWN